MSNAAEAGRDASMGKSERWVRELAKEQEELRRAQETVREHEKMEWLKKLGL
jgi:hypothetical protein